MDKGRTSSFNTVHFAVLSDIQRTPLTNFTNIALFKDMPKMAVNKELESEVYCLLCAFDNTLYVICFTLLSHIISYSVSPETLALCGVFFKSQLEDEIWKYYCESTRTGRGE